MNEVGALRSSLDASDTVGAIRQCINSPSEENMIWVLVEGSDDCKIYPKFVNRTFAKVEQVHGGVGQLLIALERLNEITNRVIAIRDADFLHLNPPVEMISNLFCTDFHDIEMMMISDDVVLKNVCHEYHYDVNEAQFRNDVLSSASYVGYVRWLNDQEAGRINFEGLGFGNYYIEAPGGHRNFDDIRLITDLNIRSRNRTIELTSELISRFVGDHETHDLYNLCCGHDVISLMALHFPTVSSKELARHFRIAYRYEDFQQTILYSNIRGWEHQTGYRVLN